MSPIATAAAGPQQVVQQTAAEHRSLAVPMAMQEWSATATSVPPAPRKVQRFIGHFPGHAQAKQAANQRAQQMRYKPTAKAVSSAPQLAAPNAPALGAVFEGPNESNTSFIPPDSQIAAGPNHLVVAINSLLAIYDKSGNQLGGFQDLDAFFAALGVNGEIFDPRLIYDQVDGRFILSVAEVDMTHFTNGHVLLAISATSDPNGAWYKYAINFQGVTSDGNSATFPDFPGLGLGPNAVYLTTNQFELNKYCLTGEFNEACAFSDAWIKVIALPELLAGNQSLNITTFRNIHSANKQLAFSLQPTLTYGTPGYEFFVAASFASDPGNTLDLFAINSSGVPTLTAGELSVPSFSIPPDAVQPGSNRLIMTNDFRTLNAVWANNELLVGQNVNSAGAAAARWYDIHWPDLSSATISQWGEVLGAGEAYFPAISVKADGSIGMAFTTSSQALPASSAFTARMAADAPGTMRSYGIYRQGAGPYDETVGNRWGDYSGISQDPDGNSLWVITQYAGTPDPHFGTAIAQITSPPFLTVTPDHLNFDGTLLGQSSAPQSVTFQNTGVSAITLGSLGTSGAAAAGFTVTADQCSGISLATGQSCTVTVIFTPPNTSEQVAYLSLTGGSGTLVVNLNGNGVQKAVLSLSASIVRFPDTPQNTSTSQALTLTNSGNIAAVFSQFGGGPPFPVTHNCGSSLAPGASCQVTVGFYPTAAISYSGNLYVMTTAGSWVSFWVQGNGITAPAAVLCPPTLDFGNQVSGTPTSPQPVILTNSGSAQLTITGISVTGDFSETDNCAGSLPERTSCTIQVTFTPSALGTRTGQITLNDNGLGNPHVIGLSGTGVTGGAQMVPLEAPVLASVPAAKPELQRRIVSAERPVSFEPNQGQFASGVQYLAHFPGYAIALTPGQLLFRFAAKDGSAPRAPADAHIVLVGADSRALPLGLDPAPGKANYFLGNDPQHWRTNVPTYNRVQLKGVYPGIDLVYYGTDRRLEYDFVVAPGAKPKNIRLRFDEASRLSVSPEGDLLVSNDAGIMRLHKPVVCQHVDDADSSTGHRVYRSGEWLVKDSSTATFKIGPYDRRRTLVIDPVLTYSTYLGGTGGDSAKAIAVDAAGNVYVAGTTGSADFPLTASAIQSTCGTMQRPCGPYAMHDGFVTKISADGSTLLYSTFLGGTDQPTDINAIAIDSAGSAYVTGSSSAPDFPVTQNAFQTACQVQPGSSSCATAFVTKLNPSGSSLSYSTFLGGPFTSVRGMWTGGTGGLGIGVDSQGNAYVGGSTGSLGFPVTAGAYQTRPPAPLTSIGFVTKLNSSGTGLVFSTYLGGITSVSVTSDSVNAIALDTAGNAYAAGTTNSVGFPTTPGAFQTGTYGSDAFVVKFTPSGSVAYSTLLGGQKANAVAVTDYANAIAVDSTGAAYITGGSGNGLPTTPGAFSSIPPSISGVPLGGFLAKFHPQGCALAYSTYTGIETGSGLAVDSAGDAYVLGIMGLYRSVPPPSSPQIPGIDAIQPQLGGSYILIREFDPTGSNLLFSTPFGGGGYSRQQALALDVSGNIYLAGDSSSIDLPVANALQPDCPYCTQPEAQRSFVAKIDPNQPAQGVTLTRSEVTFPSAAGYSLNSSSAVVGLMNNQAVPLNIQSVSVAGTGYSLTQNACIGTVMPGGGCSVGVQVVQSVAGSSSGVLTIVDDGPGSPRQVTLSVAPPQAPALTLSQTAADFGLRRVNTPAQQFITLSNSGTLPLAINSITLTGAAAFSETHNCPLYFDTIPIRASCTISITFKPASSGVQSGAIVIVDNAPGSPHVITLGGDLPGILWRNTQSGQNAIWMMNGANLVNGQFLNTISDLNWQVVGVADFDGDGEPDLVWRNTQTGQNALWLMNGPSLLSSQFLTTVTDLNWQIAGVGDFNGDGKSDILWRNTQTGQNALWIMNGATLLSSQFLPTITDLNWQIVGVADFNGDRKADILWRHTQTGQNALWVMNGVNISSAQYLNTVSDTNWQIAGVGDLDGDGHADIVWRHSQNGQNAVWLMNGASVVNAQYLATVTDLTWQIAGVQDLNGDGKADLLWRNSAAGQNVLWTMNGPNILSAQYLTSISDPNWQIVLSRSAH